MTDRTDRLIQSSGLDGDTCILIHKPSNIYYFSGFTGEGLLFITRSAKAILTDFRYAEQAGTQAPAFAVHTISNGISHARLAGDLIRQERCARALYEDDFLTVRMAGEYRAALAETAMEPIGGLPEKLREIKDTDEIRRIQEACDISCQTFEYICAEIKPGMTELEIKRLLDFRILELGAQATAFDTIVASGPNGSLPHAIPGGRKVRKGDLITLDFGAKVQGYCADMTRTVALGSPEGRLLEIFSVVLEAQSACQDALAPGRTCREIDAIARERIASAGFGDRFGHGLGHALGIDVHEEPRLNPTSTATLQPGHVVTVEPGIYIPGLGGVRIENSCLITEDGARSLVRASRELRVL